ncbi:AGAP001695-PA-like protein [Anopheles sinensis]|uniref:AGAP001695-PA-like protein n=1 Tax=Anopheles sinensis TaxID=74873 RepID=A0A084VD43_ANOSI|nr:AGAP001695-PA-like protein [Anopheles sinensis]
MSSVRDTASFFTRGNSAQFEYVLALYPQVLQLKANSKCKKPDELIKLDDWYQNKLPQLIKKRGKDQYMLHEELVKTMKWKQTRGKFFPQLSYLIKVNTPRAVQAETKKAFRKLPNLEQAITALSNLKGVGTTMASALLAAAAPETAPFMADECLMAIPEIEGIDYTTREYMNFVQHIQTTTDRLNRECHPVPAGGDEPDAQADSSSTPDASAAKGNGNGTSAEAEADASDAEDDSTNSSNEGTSSAAKKNQPDTTSDTLKAHEKKWTPHRVELALWTHYVASELQPELLENIPEEGRNNTNDTSASSSSASNHNKSDSPDAATKTNGAALAEEPSDESNSATEHGKSGPVSDESSKLGLDSLDECTKSEDSMEKPSTVTPATTTPTTTSSRKRPVPANVRRNTMYSNLISTSTTPATTTTTTTATPVRTNEHLLSSSKRRSADGERNSSGDDDDDDEQSPRLSKHTKIG